MKKHHKLPPRRDTRITSQYIPADGSIVISVARGWTGAGEVLYRLEAEKLAGIVEDKKELAVVINNLGLLVLAQLTGFNLADTLEQLPKSLAEWAHIDVKKLTAEDEQDQIQQALAIARKTLHGKHGQPSNPEDVESGPEDSDCGCRGTPDQTICAGVGCGFCRAAEDISRKETDERPHDSDSTTPTGQDGGANDGDGPGRAEDHCPLDDSGGAAGGPGVAPDEQRA